MQPDSRPFALSPFAFSGDFLSEGGVEVSRALFLSSLLFFGGGGMDLSKVGEKILSSVRSARSLGLLPSTSARPEVPARAAAAAAVARILSGLPPHQRHNLSSSSEELSSIYGSGLQGQVVEELEEEFYEEEFDPVRHVLEHIPTEENELAYFEEKAALRLTQLDMISERLSCTVMEHHEEMVKGMHLVRELEKDLKVASVICMNGRRHLISSQNEVSRDLVVNKSSKKKQALLDMLPFLTELHHALDMQIALETLVEQGNFFKAFQILSEYLQLLDSMSNLSAFQEMSRAVEAWLSKTLQKLDSLLLRVCQDFDVEGFVTVLDAYALIGDVAGLAEKIQSFFMQEVLSETHAILKGIVQEDVETPNVQSPGSRLTYSDLCYRIPESKFRHCLLETLAVLFKLMGSYYAIMSFQPENEVSVCRTPLVKQKQVDSMTIYSYSDAGGSSVSESINRVPILASGEDSSAIAASSSDVIITNRSANINSSDSIIVTRDGGSAASSSESPWFQLRKDAAGFVSHTLQRGRRNLWQLTTSRVSVLLSSAAACSPSIHQFLINYEDLNIFILAGEAFCGTEAVEFREKVKTVCENYFTAFHRQNVYALKMVIEKENWLAMAPDTIQEISFSGLVGDGAALIAPADSSPDSRVLNSSKSLGPTEKGSKKSGFSHWLQTRNPFSLKLSDTLQEQHDSFVSHDLVVSGDHGKINNENLNNNTTSHLKVDANHVNGNASIPEDENEDLHADFIDEDSQLPSRISKPKSLNFFSSHSNEEMWAQTGSSLCLLRLMDKYARLMQKLEIANVEFFKGICQLFGIFFYFVFESFCHPSSNSSGKGSTDSFSYPLKSALARIRQDYEQWIKPQTVISSPTSMNSSLCHSDVTPTSPRSTNFGHSFGTSCGLKERCAAADCVSLVAHLLHKSKAHLQMMLLQNNTAIVEDFYEHLVDAVPELTEQIHRTTARLLLHISGYVDRIACAKWDVRELGLEHNGYVDLLLGEFKHYKTRLTHGGIHKKAQDRLLEYGLESVAETLVEGLSRVKKCTDEGRALMSLDLQVLINGLRHFASIDVKPKFQVVDTFIKAYYLPETEYVHWARAHPEYSKGQIVGLINLVATMKGWKRKTKLEILEKID